MKVLSIFAMLFLTVFGCFAQSAYKSLTPGISQRADADRVLGKPVQTVSDTLIEYAGTPRTSKIYVQYRKSSSLVERIELLLVSPLDRAQVIADLHLTSLPDKSQTTPRGTLQELFDENHFIVLTYASSDAAGGVERIGYYSEALYHAAVKGIKTPPGGGAVAPPAAPAAPNPTGGMTKPAISYDDITTQAWNAMLARDFAKALSLLQDATHKNPDRAAAYALMGIAYLYGYNDFLSAEKAMREALAKNDRAMFRVYHDHDGTFHSYCFGWLYIGKSDVTFQSDQGHGFQMNVAEIQEAKLNNLFGAGYFAFHIKGKQENYNLAPGSLNKAESSLILRLLAQ